MATGRKSWRRRSAARPGEILQAALAEFSRKGFAATRMEDIARLSNITKGTIYLYYKDKENLFRTLIEETIGNGLAAAAKQATSSHAPAKQKLTGFLTDVAGFFGESGRTALLKIIISECGNFPELASLYRTEIIDRIALTLLRVIDEDAEKYELRRLPAEQIAQLCVAPVLLTMLWRASFASADEYAFDERAAVATQLDIILRGCFANPNVYGDGRDRSEL
jgi:AcrR family transcriptional regulator